jgi:quaternary ammonium compound-resistance protein SugE
MDWLILFIAGGFECCWAVGLKYTVGFTKFWPTVFTIVTMAMSLWLLSIAMKTIPLGTAYAVWTGTGAVCVVIIGMFFLGEPKAIARIICLALIIAGIVGLKVFAHSH